MASISHLNNFDLEEDDGVARLVIDSSTEHNTLNPEWGREFLEIVTKLGEKESVRCMVITGSDSVFCAGADINMFSEGISPAEIRQLASVIHDGIVQLHQCSTPVITGVNGPAVGAGFSFAMLGDIVIAREDAHFAFGFEKLGFPGDTGSTFFLPRLVGLRKAKEIALLGESIPPDEAVELGIATEVVPKDGFEDRLTQVSDKISSGPTDAYGMIKELLTKSSNRELAVQLAAETDAMAEALTTEEHREAVHAFSEDRSPEFKGK